MSPEDASERGGRGSRLTPGLVVIAMGFGAMSASLAMLFETVGALGIYSAGIRDMDLFIVMVAILVAPAVEEAVKPLGLLISHFEMKLDLRLTDWAILGFLAGLGFKILEDLMYIFLSFGPIYGADGMLAGALIRVHFPVHMLATTISGFGVGLWHQSGRVTPFILALSMAIAIHAAFNLSVSL